MPRLPIVLVLLVALAAGIALAWPESPSPAGPAAAQPGAAAAAGAAVDAADAAAPGAPAATADGTSAAEPAAHRVAAVPEDPDAGRPKATLRVVEFGSGAPVAGAVVRFARPQDRDGHDPEIFRQNSRRMDLEWLLERVGGSTTTDADGRCAVPLAPKPLGTEVTARHGALYGETYLQPDQAEEPVVVVRPDATLRVLVLAASGRPAAGVMVEAEREPEQDRSAGAQEPWTRFQLGYTEEDGRLERSHCQLLIGRQRKAARMRITAMVPHASSATVDVDFAAPPAEVVLHLPPTGSVTVRVLEADGSPVDLAFLGDRTVQLGTFAERPMNSQQETDGRNRSSVTAVLGADGTATFRHVALDRFLIAWFGHTFEPARFAGPTLAEPHVTATLQRGTANAVLTGRLLDPAGEPVREQTMTITQHYAHGKSSTGLRTDGEGRFRADLGEYGAGRESTLRIGTRPGGVAGNPPGMAVELPSRTLRAGRNELGDVRLEAFRVLLAGRVVRGEGTGARPLWLQFERRQGDRWDQDWELPNNQHWPEPDRFEVHGLLPAGTPLRLLVPAGNWLPVPPIECMVGATDLRIELRLAASVTATFLVDETTPVARLVYRLERTEPPQEREAMAAFHERHLGPMLAEAQRDGRAEHTWSGLTAGTYRLRVLCPGTDEPIQQLDALRVADGPCDDPRLQAVDLRGRVRTVRVRAVAADGTEVRDRDAFVVPVGGGTEWAGFHLGEGVVDLALGKPVDVLVVAPGHRIERLVAVTGDQTAQLQRAHEVRLAVELPFALPEGDELQVIAEPQAGFDERASIALDTGRGMSLSDFLAETARVKPDGVAVLAVRLPGPHRLTGLLGRWVVRGFEPRDVDLGSGVTSATVALTEKGLRDTLDRRRR